MDYPAMGNTFIVDPYSSVANTFTFGSVASNDINSVFLSHTQIIIICDTVVRTYTYFAVDCVLYIGC